MQDHADTHILPQRIETQALSMRYFGCKFYRDFRPLGSPIKGCHQGNQLIGCLSFIQASDSYIGLPLSRRSLLPKAPSPCPRLFSMVTLADHPRFKKLGSSEAWKLEVAIVIALTSIIYASLNGSPAFVQVAIVPLCFF
jgi:hypothetical protein